MDGRSSMLRPSCWAHRGSTVVPPTVEVSSRPAFTLTARLWNPAVRWCSPIRSSTCTSRTTRSRPSGVGSVLTSTSQLNAPPLWSSWARCDHWLTFGSGVGVVGTRQVRPEAGSRSTTVTSLAA